MKIISLNLWAGLVGRDEIIKFLQSHLDGDVFCFQEMWDGGKEWLDTTESEGLEWHKVDTELYSGINTTLTEHSGYFRPQFSTFMGLAMFIKKTHRVVEEGDIFVYKERGHIPDGHAGDHARNIQYVTIDRGDSGKLTVINFHGLWKDESKNGKGKRDTEDRLAQSDNILKFTNTLTNPYILCGDFNLHPETESLKKLEDSGLRNLVKEYNITSTRTSYYTKPEKFADYMLVSEGVTVTDFKVLPDEVSDHAPLLVDIE